MLAMCLMKYRSLAFALILLGSSGNHESVAVASQSEPAPLAAASQDTGPETGATARVGGSAASSGAWPTGSSNNTGGFVPAGGAVTAGGDFSVGASLALTGSVVGTHFDVIDCSAKLVGALPPQSQGTSIFAWIKFPVNLAISTALAFGRSILFYQDYGFYADNGGAIWWWDENYGPRQIATNIGEWIFIVARFTSDTHVDVGYTRTAGNAITWSVRSTISLNALQGMTISFSGESEWFGGDLEYAGVLPRAVSDSEAAALSAGKQAPNNAWAFWKFENGNVTDSSGNGRNWIVTGSTSAASTGAPIDPVAAPIPYAAIAALGFALLGLGIRKMRSATCPRPSPRVTDLSVPTLRRRQKGRKTVRAATTPPRTSDDRHREQLKLDL
jgi:hypothetical protein